MVHHIGQVRELLRFVLFDNIGKEVYETSLECCLHAGLSEPKVAQDLFQNRIRKGAQPALNARSSLVEAHLFFTRRAASQLAACVNDRDSVQYARPLSSPSVWVIVCSHDQIKEFS